MNAKSLYEVAIARKNLGTWALIATGMLAAACAADTRSDGAGGAAGESGLKGPPESAPGLAPTARTAESVTINDWVIGPYEAGPSGWVDLEWADTHVCTLAKVQGEFVSGSANAWVLDIGGRWVLQTGPGNWGSAYCFRRDAFVGPDNSVNWLSGYFSVGYQGCTDWGASTDMWLGDADSWIAGVAGRLDYNPPTRPTYVNASWSGNGYRASRLFAMGCLQGDVGLALYGYSFFVGVPHVGSLAKWVGGHQGGYKQWAIHTFQQGSPAFQQIDTGAPLQGSMCHFQRIEGMFRDANDYAALSHNGSTWFLSVGSGTYGVGLREKSIAVACLNKDQR
jgi:hypothetical protein